MYLVTDFFYQFEISLVINLIHQATSKKLSFNEYLISIFLEKRKIIPRDSNVSESPLWMSTDKTDKTLQTNQGLQTTPILIGVIVFLCLILTAVAARFLWKKMTGTRLIMSIGDSEMRTTAMVGEIGQVDDMVDHDYEDLDEGKIGKDNMKEKKAASENDYVESLAFAKKEQNANERESKHFYDALK